MNAAGRAINETYKSLSKMLITYLKDLKKHKRLRFSKDQALQLEQMLSVATVLEMYPEPRDVKQIDNLLVENKRYKDLIATHDFPKKSDECGTCQSRRKVVLDLRANIDEAMEFAEFIMARNRCVCHDSKFCDSCIVCRAAKHLNTKGMAK